MTFLVPLVCAKLTQSFFQNKSLFFIYVLCLRVFRELTLFLFGDNCSESHYKTQVRVSVDSTLKKTYGPANAVRYLLNTIFAGVFKKGKGITYKRSLPGMLRRETLGTKLTTKEKTFAENTS